jgi:hypothetical protein
MISENVVRAVKARRMAQKCSKKPRWCCSGKAMIVGWEGQEKGEERGEGRIHEYLERRSLWVSAWGRRFVGEMERSNCKDNAGNGKFDSWCGGDASSKPWLTMRRGCLKGRWGSHTKAARTTWSSK